MVGLASVIIGETLFPSTKLFIAILSVIMGSVVYRCVIAFALNSTDLGLKASDLNLITAALVALTMIAPKLGKRMRPGKIIP